MVFKLPMFGSNPREANAGDLEEALNAEFSALGSRTAALEALGATGYRFAPLGPVVAASTAADGDLARSGAYTVDGVTLNDGDAYVAQFQADPAENGVLIYNSSGPHSRRSDFDAPGDFRGKAVTVTGGADYGGRVLICYSEVATVGADPVEWTLGPDTSGLQSQIDGKAELFAPIPNAVLSGTANSQSFTVTGLSAYQVGQTYLVYPSETNTSADVSYDLGPGPLPVLVEDGVAKPGVGEILAFRPLLLRVSSTEEGLIFRLAFRDWTRGLGDLDQRIDDLNLVYSDRFGPLLLLASEGGTPDAQRVPAPVGMTAYANNQSFIWFPNATTADDPTLEVGDLGPLPLYRGDGSRPAAGDFGAGGLHILRVSGAADRLLSVTILPSEVRDLSTGVSEAAVSVERQERAAVDRLRDIQGIYTNLLPSFEPGLAAGSTLTAEVSDTGVPLLVTQPGAAAGGYWDAGRIARDRIPGNAFNAGVTFFEGGTNARVLILQADAEGAEISGARTTFQPSRTVVQSDPEAVEALDVPIHTDCATLRFYQDGPDGPDGTTKTGLHWMHPTYRRFLPPAPSIAGTLDVTIHLSPSGSDGNSGRTDAEPMATMAAAHAAGARRVILADGTYSVFDARLDGTAFDTIEVMAAPDALPIIRGGHAVTGFTAVAGRSNVYRAACTVAPVLNDPSSPKGFVWILGVPWGPISMADRHPVHQGRSHRAPHHPVHAGPTDLDGLEAASRASWYWSDDVLYIQPPAGVDPDAMVVQVPTNSATFVNRGRHNTLRLQGLTYEFCGLRADGIQRYDLSGVAVIGAPFDGFSLDHTSGVHRFCAAVGASNDGFNLHGTTANTPGRTDGYARVDNFEHGIDAWACLCWDDGRSIHEGSRARVDGGLFERNGSTGSAPANGAEETMFGTEIRDNGWDGNEDAGIAMVNGVSDDGTGCVFAGHNLVIRGSAHGLAVLGGAQHKAQLFDTRSFDVGSAVLYAAEGATVTSYGLIDDGSAPRTSGPGTIRDL